MDFVVVAPGQTDALIHIHGKPGGWEPIENIEDPYVQEMGRFAMMEYAKNMVGASMKFICVVSGEIQIVSEAKLYRLVVKVEEQIINYPMMSGRITTYLATVLEKPLDRSWKLLSFVPSNN